MTTAIIILEVIFILLAFAAFDKVSEAVGALRAIARAVTGHVEPEREVIVDPYLADAMELVAAGAAATGREDLAAPIREALEAARERARA